MKRISRALPPGQQLAAPGRWPIIGEKLPDPTLPLDRLEITGLVREATSWSLSDLASLPQQSLTLDIHCVTRWSMLDVEFSGVELAVLLELAGWQPSARFISFVSSSSRGHSSSLPLDEALSLGTLVALGYHGNPLPVEHGGPIRNIVPGRYFYKSVKWLARIELLAEDRLGYWEAESGYHNRADPWLEQRYMAPTIDRRAAQRLIDSRDFSGHDLRSLDASHRDMQRLRAVGSLLRDADFRHCDLRRADFSNANLSNAHFQGADLRGARFLGADVEGANFSGADLRQAEWSGASLIGCSFWEPAGPDQPARYARLEPGVAPFTPEQLDALSPDQLEFLKPFL